MATKARAAVVGVGHSKVHRRDDISLGALTVDACRNAIADAGLKPSDIDGLACAPNVPLDGNGDVNGIDLVRTNFIARALDLDLAWGADVVGMVGQSLVQAIHAIAAGGCNYALVFRSMHGPQGRYGRSNPSELEGQRQYTGSYGMFAPVMFATMWSRYQQKYNSGTREQMATYIVNNRKNALMWEHGHWYQHRPEPLTIEDYLTARTISTPFCLFDCDIPVQGSGAWVVTSAEGARDLPNPPAYVLGTTSPVHGGERVGPFVTLERQMEEGKRVAKHLWENAGVDPRDVDVANLYDGFSIITPLWLEAMGFCGEGEAFEFMQDGRIELDGELPLNTSSGNLGAGRMHGVPHFIDGALQVMGRSGPRQVKDAESSVAMVGPHTGAAGIVFGRNPGV